MRMQLNLVSFKQATALKNLGFPALSADWSYRNDGELYNFVDDDGYVTAAPTLELAAKWLREEKQIMIDMIYEYMSPQSWSSNVTSRNHLGTVPVVIISILVSTIAVNGDKIPRYFIKKFNKHEKNLY